jgi:ArsR family transcriptional regulator
MRSRPKLVTTFHALSDATRLAVLDRLRGGERCVCDLADLLDAGQSRLSFHMKVLRKAAYRR